KGPQLYRRKQIRNLYYKYCKMQTTKQPNTVQQRSRCIQRPFTKTNSHHSTNRNLHSWINGNLCTTNNNKKDYRTTRKHQSFQLVNNNSYLSSCIYFKK